MATKKNAPAEVDFDAIDFSDDSLALDLTALPENEFPEREPLKPGKYLVEVVEARYEPTKKDPDARQFVWVFQTVNPEDNNTRIWYYNVFSGNGKSIALRRFAEAIVAALPEFDLTKVTPEDFERAADEVVGEQVTVQLKRGKPYNGKPSTDVQKVLPPDNSETGGLDFD